MAVFQIGLGLGLVVSLLLLVCWLDHQQKYRDVWLSKYQPMSDDEFMEQLPAGTSREIGLRVRTIVAKQTGVPRDRIRPDSKFMELVN